MNNTIGIHLHSQCPSLFQCLSLNEIKKFLYKLWINSFCDSDCNFRWPSAGVSFSNTAAAAKWNQLGNRIKNNTGQIERFDVRDYRSDHSTPEINIQCFAFDDSRRNYFGLCGHSRLPARAGANLRSG